MRTRRILAAVAAILVGLAGAPLLTSAPARAGNFAVTLLDPLPERLEPGRGYTVGLWVLQHGFHPYEGDLGRVALRLVGADGESVSFPASALPEPAHYAAAVAVPRSGVWTVVAVQGRFADYRIGTLTAPGKLTVLGVPSPLQSAETEKHWPGAIRPPTVPVDLDRDPYSEVAAPAPVEESGAAAAPAGSRAAPDPAEATSRRTFLVGGTLLVVALVGLGLVAGRRRLRPRRPERPTTA
ncbi:hypothetical protein [Plantactinospora endophytica]|uniref:Uncharacterized protein n=1 Tax=Plantactinospora endophytica TaxID=673535 RepID=A0ABQ4E1N7_9ACTN|nr:hypothetical protein [Plantactinospora endophytica]GIG88613.1 hypothetical protein Pen02_35490 [Plantactinospora endophytica]